METKTLVGRRIPAALGDTAALVPLVEVDALDLLQVNVAVAQAVVEAFQALRDARAARELRMLRLQVQAARVSVEVAQRTAQAWQEQLAERSALTARRQLRRVG